MVAALKNRLIAAQKAVVVDGIEIASRSFFVESVAGVCLLRIPCRGSVKDASLCTIRRPGDFTGDHVQGDF